MRAGKTAVKPSTRERLQKKSPLGYTALTIIIFVLVGGGSSTYHISVQQSHNLGRYTSTAQSILRTMSMRLQSIYLPDYTVADYPAAYLSCINHYFIWIPIDHTLCEHNCRDVIN